MTTEIMLADMAVVLGAGLLLGGLMRVLRQPAVMGEMLAGILLGPSVLGAISSGHLEARLFPADVQSLLNAVAQVGLVLFMFVIGWEFEERLIRIHGRLALGISLASVAFSFGLGAALARWLYPRYAVVAGNHVSLSAFTVFLGTAMSVTAFPVLARILSDNRITHTRVGSLALASAAVDDILAWCLLAFVSAMVSAHGDYYVLLRIGCYSAFFVLGMLLVARPLLAGLLRRWSAAGYWSPLFVILGAGVFISSWLTSWIGLHQIFGAFLFGFIMPRESARQAASRLGDPLGKAILLLLPVFFVVTGLEVNLGALTPGDYIALLLIITVACAGKMLGVVIPARMARLPWRESKDLALLMNSRGLTELIILNAAVSMRILDTRMFTLMVIMAFATTALAGPLLSRADEIVELTAERPMVERL